MTVAEICLALDRDMERRAPDPGSINFTHPAQAVEYVTWLRGLSPLERLQLAREKYR